MFPADLVRSPATLSMSSDILLFTEKERRGYSFGEMSGDLLERLVDGCSFGGDENGVSSFTTLELRVMCDNGV